MLAWPRVSRLDSLLFNSGWEGRDMLSDVLLVYRLILFLSFPVFRGGFKRVRAVRVRGDRGEFNADVSESRRVRVVLPMLYG
jgi:hypothetical protein